MNRLALFTDLYQLTMLQAYFEEEMLEDAVFSLFVRRLPQRRNFLVACGLEDVLDYLEQLRFADEDVAYIESLGSFSNRFLDRLRDFRFTGSVHAVAEGTPVFANEPILEVTAPLPQGQLIETFVMNQIHVQTVLASKASRVVAAARGRPVIDFGARRMHGIDAALKAARAFYVGGVAATSNVLAGERYGVPLAGTMAHSYIQAHHDEAEAFATFARIYPETILLVDTYDTLAGVRKVIELARVLGDAFKVRGVRLDSGDLATLSRDTRRLLDDAGLERVEIIASGGLDEDTIDRLLASQAPIDGFGVGTNMGVSNDAPALDMAYKLTEYAGKGRLKLSPGKPILPGRKQIFRGADGDTIARADEDSARTALLAEVMRGGRRVGPTVPLEEIRAHARESIAQLPEAVRNIAPAQPPYRVEVSPALAQLQRHIADELERGSP